MKRRVFGVLMAVGVLVSQSFAQEPTKVLTFEEAVKIAMQNGILLNQQKNNLELSQLQRIQSIAAVGPSVSLNSQVARLDGNSFNNNTGTVVNGIRDNVTGSINANINVFSGFNRMSQIKQYANALDAQAYFVNRTGQDLINTVANQYLRVMLDVELLKIARENYEALNKQLEQVKEQVNLGARSPVDEYNQDALTKAAELRQVMAEIALNNDKTLLVQTLLIDPFEQFDVEKPNWDINVIGNSNDLNIQELSEKAKLYRGDYLRAVKLETAQKFAMKATWGNMLPQLYAFGSYGSAYNYQHNQPDSVTNAAGVRVRYQPAFDDQFKRNNVYKQYGFQLSIPIFNGLQTRTQRMQQQVLYENNQLNKKNLEYQIKNDVQRSVRNYEGARKAYAVTTDQVKAAELAFQLEKERYDLGVTNFVDFTNANRVLVQAQTDKAQAEFTLVFQKILIDYAVGTLKVEDLQH